jgi:hypothetical protein
MTVHAAARGSPTREMEHTRLVTGSHIRLERKPIGGTDEDLEDAGF